MPTIGTSDLDVFPLCLGGNTFGWTTDQKASEAVLDAYMESGGNFVDTADVYARWVPGNAGGESERALGQWMAERRNRHAVVIATKVMAPMGSGPNDTGLSRAHIMDGVEASLRRLQTDYIDLYQAHWDDRETKDAYWSLHTWSLKDNIFAPDAWTRSLKKKEVSGQADNDPRWLVEGLGIWASYTTDDHVFIYGKVSKAAQWHSGQQLPEGISFSGLETIGDTRSDAALSSADASASGGTAQVRSAEQEVSPILFYPDGTTSTARLVLANAHDRYLILELRGLTGVVKVSDVLSGEEL